MVAQRVIAFRDFAGRLAAQVVEQMCQEFEREVGELWNDVCMYRDELDRVAQLLGGQLEREKKLHGVIEAMVGHGSNMHSQAQYLAQQGRGSDGLHQMLEQHMAHHQSLLDQTHASIGEASQVLGAYYQGAQQFKEPLISAENEFMRIVELLQNPPIHGNMPSPTVALVPGQFTPTPRGFTGTPPPSAGQISPSMAPPNSGMVFQPNMTPVRPRPPFMQQNSGLRGPPGGMQPQVPPERGPPVKFA